MSTPAVHELRLQFAEAAGLQVVQTYGQQDPYVSVVVTSASGASEPVRTPPAPAGGVTPVWPAPQPLLQVFGGSEDTVDVEVLNSNLLVPDESIARTSTPLGRLLAHAAERAAGELCSPYVA